MSSELEYPHNILATNELRRVLGALPITLSDEERAEVKAASIESIREARLPEFKDEEIAVPEIPVSLTLDQLTALLEADPHAYHGAETQVTGEAFIGAVEGPNFTPRFIAGALTELIGLGFVEEHPDGSYSTTHAGLDALRS